jgi:hypothetical protein
VAAVAAATVVAVTEAAAATVVAVTGTTAVEAVEATAVAAAADTAAAVVIATAAVAATTTTAAEATIAVTTVAATAVAAAAAPPGTSGRYHPHPTGSIAALRDKGEPPPRCPWLSPVFENRWDLRGCATAGALLPLNSREEKRDDGGKAPAKG